MALLPMDGDSMNNFIRWKAGLPDLYFWCRDCQQWILEGNPLACPHNQSILSRPAKATYDPDREGPVYGIGAVLRACGYKHLAEDMEDAMRPDHAT